ncbi:MAG: hypothetical protein ACJAX4_000709 [Clostridium sp.]|jgi:hypothetical protein
MNFSQYHYKYIPIYTFKFSNYLNNRDASDIRGMDNSLDFTYIFARDGYRNGSKVPSASYVPKF